MLVSKVRYEDISPEPRIVRTEVLITGQMMGDFLPALNSAPTNRGEEELREHKDTDKAGNYIQTPSYITRDRILLKLWIMHFN